MWPFPFIAYHNKIIGYRVETRFQQGIVNSVMRMNEVEIENYENMLEHWPDTEHPDDYLVALHACSARKSQIHGTYGYRHGPFTRIFSTALGWWGAWFNASTTREARQYFKDQNRKAK